MPTTVASLIRRPSASRASGMLPPGWKTYCRFGCTVTPGARTAWYVASTNASLFAYVADGRAGMKVIQLTSPDSQPNFYGFSPAPMPELIAWAKTPSPALAMSKGLDRDRAVDETGGQIAVFGRLGSRPFTRPEMERLFLNRRGVPWKVVDQPEMDRWIPARGAGR